MATRPQDTYDQWAHHVARQIVNGQETPAANDGAPPTLPGISSTSRDNRWQSVDRDAATINEVENNLQTAVARSPRSSVPAGFDFQLSDHTLASNIDLEKQEGPAFEPESDEPESSNKDEPENEKQEEEKDPNLIEWDGPDDPENPQ